jgi:AcrR family transcriptional regulator
VSREGDEDGRGLSAGRATRVRNSLIAAAVELFMVKGYAGTTVDDIAARAGVSRRTFFRYFGSKDEVVDSDKDIYRQQLYDALVTRPLTEDDFTAARNVLAQERIYSSLDRLRLQQACVASMPQLAGRLYGARREYEDMFALALARRRGKEESTLEERLKADLISAAAARGLREWYERRQDEPPHVVVASVMDVLLRQYSV